jgi:hypothetical protein
MSNAWPRKLIATSPDGWRLYHTLGRGHDAWLKCSLIAPKHIRAECNDRFKGAGRVDVGYYYFRWNGDRVSRSHDIDVLAEFYPAAYEWMLDTLRRSVDAINPPLAANQQQEKHPVDQLFEIRAHMRELQDMDRDLRARIIQNTDDLRGEVSFAFVAERENICCDIEAARQHFGGEFDRFLTHSTTPALYVRSIDYED